MGRAVHSRDGRPATARLGSLAVTTDLPDWMTGRGSVNCSMKGNPVTYMALLNKPSWDGVHDTVPVHRYDPVRRVNVCPTGETLVQAMASNGTLLRGSITNLPKPLESKMDD